MIGVSRALLDVLFASLWQDAIIGVCVGAILAVAGKRLNAATRHTILQAALVVMVVVPAATTLPHVTSGSVTAIGYGGASSASAIAPSNAQSMFIFRSIEVTLADRVVFTVVAIWLAAVVGFAIRILLGAVHLSRFARRSDRLADRNGVRVYASSCIPVPVAIGLVHPAIIIPSDIVDGGGKELECVLLHELAHVQRRDAWSHTFERVIRAALFFNPAIILLLQSLALEREAACDDWAVAHSRDTAAYTHSLALLAVRTSFNIEMPATCGVIGFGHGIVNRIERLEDQSRNGSLILSPLTIGGFAFVLVSIALSLQLLVPAVAFAPKPAMVQTAATVSNCSRSATITIPAQPSGPLPSGTARVEVFVSAAGSVTGARVAYSSGSVVLDRAAVKLARESAYAPALRNCKPVAGAYQFILSSGGP